MLRRVSAMPVPGIEASTRFCAVLGHPIHHSASPAMQNAGIRELGLDWCYLAFDVHPDSLASAIAGAAAMKFIGLNLTVPHKLLALDLVDVLDDSARTWGAVNTVGFEARIGGEEWRPMGMVPAAEVTAVRSHGYNTDADAIIRAVREDLGVNLKGRSVLLLGAGGAGRVAALKLAAEGVKRLYLVNRTESKAAALAEEMRVRFPKVIVEVGYPDGTVDLLINATSLGLGITDDLPLDTSRFDLASAGAVYDMIYRPAETRLLKAARKAGRPSANGLGMLLYQGARALEIWTGQSPPIAAMREALEQNVYGQREPSV